MKHNYLYKSVCYLLLLNLLLACSKPRQEYERNKDFDFYESALFKDVQLSGIFNDSKTFVDCVADEPLDILASKYKKAVSNDTFDLSQFVHQHFKQPQAGAVSYQSDTAKSMDAHINELWPILTRQPDSTQENSSLIPLPNAYVVPGGRFREVYYWDSYFTMEGLVRSSEHDLAKAMVDNFSFLIDSIGFIPNGNRDYYLGRSQPPFYALMVDLIADNNPGLWRHYLPYLIKEYDFWMKGVESISDSNKVTKRVVMLDDSTTLNRYWDHYTSPRPESYKEDYELIQENNLDSAKAYRHLRAGAESGWDYSSRWLADDRQLSTIHTTDIIPVDLNALLYHLEMTIAKAYDQSGREENAKAFRLKAAARKRAINAYLWNEQIGFYMDFDYIKGKSTRVKSMASAYPLFFNIANTYQAESVTAILLKDFLKAGGFVTTLNNTGQQWDAPNGWAPLQWIAVKGLINYDFDKEAIDAAEKWLTRNRQVYKATGKMMEKYNVEDTTLQTGGGEYALQDGFGWTNGVVLALESLLVEQEAE
ncbi:alpha,alpha-trehalase TreF [Fulvivirga sediminis]|uniref:Alpha,alpha-trehalase TreF n=1 Tax=Fulvivirga sediminis TaxID=2803949 RepID=A0A937F7I6_9BACT|nr:alpha,alpha-trehalase TreF [Fulvivirga sediminis]MBL3655714.1 alpha,alpha-trehalase TreF [Fulvivirga sediminis]